MKRKIWNQQNKGQQRREARKQKHKLRAEIENQKMNKKKIKFDYEYWGWTMKDKSPFLRIGVYFEESVIPVNFITSIEKAITDKYNEYLQESKIPEKAKCEENESDSPDLLLGSQRASLD